MAKMVKDGGALTYQPEKIDSELEKELIALEQKTTAGEFSSLIEQIQAEYKLSYDYLKPKWGEWAMRLQLYNNQKRDKEAVGDPLLFTTHQTVLASLYMDKLSVAFVEREEGDVDAAENLNHLARYDYGDMGKDELDYEWDWDSSFFGRGLMLFKEFIRKLKVPMPEVIDVMTFLRDPRATSVNGDRRGHGRARFLGREVRMTLDEMKEAGVYFNLEALDYNKGSNNESQVDQNRQIRASAQGLADPLNFNPSKGANQEYRLLEWFTIWGGKRVFVTLANDQKTVTRYDVLPSFFIPIIDRAMYPISHDWDGVSVPDLVEDKQRARAITLNLGLKGIKSNLLPMYLYDTNRIKNRFDLDFGFNKHVPVDGDTNGAMQPVARQHIGTDADWIMKMLDTAAQKSTATPDMAQGMMNTQDRPLGETQLVDANKDRRYSLSAKIFGWSEKRFWAQWYSLYKTHFKDGIDEKMVRIRGAMGTKFRPFTRENIIADIDPDIEIESKALADAERMTKLQLFNNYMALVVSDPTSNKRYGLRKLGRLSGMDNDELDMLLPPTIDEMKADDENQVLNQNKVVDVHDVDDDNVHLEIHNKAADTSAKYAHLRAHKTAMLLKKVQQQQQAEQAAQTAAAQGNTGGTPPGAPPSTQPGMNPKADVQKAMVSPTIQKNKPRL